MRTVRTATHRYILNLAPELRFTNHITSVRPDAEGGSSNHYLAFWSTWVEKAKTDQHAKETVYRYLHRPKEELFDLRSDPFEMNNLADDLEQAELLNSLRIRLQRWCEMQADEAGVAAFSRGGIPVSE